MARPSPLTVPHPRPGSATVLIPAHNEAATIQRCIAAVRAGGYPLERIIVVADACTDDTAQLGPRVVSR